MNNRLCDGISGGYMVVELMYKRDTVIHLQGEGADEIDIKVVLFITLLHRPSCFYTWEKGQWPA